MASNGPIWGFFIAVRVCKSDRSRFCTSKIKDYTPAPVSDLPVSVQNPAIDGHPIRLSTELNDSQVHVAVNDNITKFQNLDFDPIMSIRLKTSDIEEKLNLSTLI